MMSTATGNDPHVMQFRLFMDCACDYALIFCDGERRVTAWAAGAESMFGYRASEMIGRPADIIFTEADIAAGQPEREAAAALADGQANDERWHRRADGTLLFAAGRMVALRDGNGVLHGFAKILRDVTAEKERAAQLRDVVERLNLATNATGIGIWEFNFKTGQLNASGHACRVLGLPVDAPQSPAVFYERIAPEHRDTVRDNMALARDPTTARPVSVQFRVHGGEPGRWILARAFPVRSDDGREIERLLGTMTDISSEKAAEESLHASLAEVRLLQRSAEQSAMRYREIFATANEGIWTLDADARIELVNERLAGMLGYEIPEMIGRAHVEFGFPEDASRWRERFAERRRGLPAWIDVRFRHRRGHEVWALMSARPLIRQGQFAGELDMFTDITARRAAEQALRVSEEQFRTFFESAAAGHASIDPITRLFLRVNRRFAEITGYTPEELRGRPLATVMHPDELATETDLFARLMAGSLRELAEEKRFLHKSGRVVWVQMNSSLVRDGDQQPLRQIVVVQDITDRKLAEIELQDLKQNLETQVALRTSQLEVKTAQLEGFCYTVAHDLRSPLRAISGYAELLLDESRSGNAAGAETYVAKIKAASRRLDSLITDLLQYSRVSQLGIAIEDVALDDVLTDVRAQLAEEIAARGAVVSIPEHLPVVRAERPLLQQVIVNLLSNALKFVAPGKTPRVSVTVEHRAENARLVVADNGIGVAPAYHRRIFGVFERLSDARNYPGTGVGLAIVQKAMERVGGTYGVESGSGEGSRFWIELRKARE
jgi:PAS domain S-box-containing protein